MTRSFPVTNLDFTGASYKLHPPVGAHLERVLGEGKESHFFMTVGRAFHIMVL